MEVSTKIIDKIDDSQFSLNNLRSLLNSINVMIVDDHELFRDGLSNALLHLENVRNVYHADGYENALKQLNLNKIQMIFVDYCMPHINGACCTREIKRLNPEMKIIGMSVFNDKEHILEMVNNGADGFLSKSVSIIEIDMAIKKIMKGNHYFSNDITSAIVDEAILKIKFDSEGKFDPLTEREKEILKLLYQEHSSKVIGDILSISKRTVEFYRRNLIKKTGAKNIVGLIKYAMRHNLVE